MDKSSTELLQKKDKMNNVFGVDIAKKTFDVFGLLEAEKRLETQFSNDGPGHRSFSSALPADACIVMEASGPYYLRLASALHQSGFQVVVLNPLVSRRFAQMKLSRTKTDRVDARLLAEYGRVFYPDLSPWEPPKAVFVQLRQLNTALRLSQKQLSMLRNQQAAFHTEGLLDPRVEQVQNQLICALKASIKALEKQMNDLCKMHFEASYKRLQSIPGVGPKTASMLITITRDFTAFESAKQLVAYIGLCPRIFQSGTSVKGKGAINKMGQPALRACLYMGAFSAMKRNPDCAKKAQQLKERGKHYRVIRVAVAHQLVRQAFAIATQKTTYQPQLIEQNS